mmetsp:Transcript_20032/g.49231  ORF Transcript_20032/g.49231 Transcript_20032/m.49231 type:complete len:207 (-) Transcript_20032:35-655(-)
MRSNTTTTNAFHFMLLHCIQRKSSTGDLRDLRSTGFHEILSQNSGSKRIITFEIQNVPQRCRVLGLQGFDFRLQNANAIAIAAARCRCGFTVADAPSFLAPGLEFFFSHWHTGNVSRLLLDTGDRWFGLAGHGIDQGIRCGLTSVCFGTLARTSINSFLQRSILLAQGNAALTSASCCCRTFQSRRIFFGQSCHDLYSLLWFTLEK